MKLFLRLAPWALVGALAVAFAACSSEAENNSSTTSGGGAGGAGGAGGEGGGPGASSSTASGTGGGGGAPDVILTCPEKSYTFKSGTCDFLNQDCPPNEACYPVLENGVYVAKCVPWAGVKQMGSPCVEHSECEAGLFCGFYCSPPCCALDNKPCPSSCNFEIPFGAVDTAKVCNLAPKCEFFMEDVCKPGAYCRFDASQGVATCAPRTDNIDGETPGKSCKFLNDCGHMQTCQGPMDQAKCRFSCDIEKQSAEPGKGGCPSGEECIQYNPKIMAYPNLGHCETAP